MPDDVDGFWENDRAYTSIDGSGEYLYHRLTWISLANATGNPQTVILEVGPDADILFKLNDGESLGTDLPDVYLPDGFALTMNGCTGVMVVASAFEAP